MQSIAYTWDEEKAKRNIRFHEVAFEDAIKIFDGPTVERLDDRFDYAEERWYAIGLVGEHLLTVVYTDIDERTRRIISAWKAERHEQAAYFEHLGIED